jgi:hypothetical protein
MSTLQKFRDSQNSKEPKRQNLTSVDGFIGGIQFSLSGPVDHVHAITKFIKNLTSLQKGYLKP